MGSRVIPNYDVNWSIILQLQEGIVSQFRKVQEKVIHQVKAIFKFDSESQFNESIANELGIDKDSMWWQPTMMIITHVIRRLDEVRTYGNKETIGEGDKAVYEILSGGNSDKFLR